MRKITSLLLLAALTLAAPTAVLAAPKSGCPAEVSGFELMTVSAAAARIFPDLLPGQFETEEELETALRAAYDSKSPDGLLCMKTMWGEALNPKSHWYRVGLELFGEPVHQFLPMDNRSAASS